MSEKIKVKSSNLEFVEYIADKKELRIWFLNDRNAVYAYADVSQEVYDELIKASSIGGFFKDHIKFKYRFNKINKTMPKDVLEVDCPHCQNKVEVDVSIYGYKLEEI